MDDKYIRQQELVNQEKLANLHVTIIGCGAVGSFTALSLCKMGVGQLTLIDPDEVNIENLPNQFFREDDIGEKKVAACMEILKDFNNQVDVEILPRPFIKQKLESDIVISAVDSMTIRKRIWKSVITHRTVKLLIDPRMAAQVIQVYSVKPGVPNGSKAYEATLIDDSETLEERCTARSIIYSVLPLAGLVCRQVAAYANDDWIEPVITLDLKTLTLIRKGVQI
ncbi:MAG: ThiF family adenylyltransferase [candidate division Zixibacteria bacterium]|nr:ThiF family adenylyltransferase [candidate division Zixibacteria bacterium]